MVGLNFGVELGWLRLNWDVGLNWDGWVELGFQARLFELC